MLDPSISARYSRAGFLIPESQQPPAPRLVVLNPRSDQVFGRHKRLAEARKVSRFNVAGLLAENSGEKACFSGQGCYLCVTFLDLSVSETRSNLLILLVSCPGIEPGTY